MKIVKSLPFVSVMFCIVLTMSACAGFGADQIEIKPATVNNAYNNSKSTQDCPDLAQIGDKIYYHYHNRFGAHDDYVIGNGYSKKLKTEGRLDLNNLYQGRLLDVSTNPITEYRSDTNEWIPCDDIKLPDDLSHYRVSVCNDTLYLETYEELYRYTGSAFQKWVTSEELGVRISLSEMYIDGDIIYYHKETENTDSFCRYDTTSKQTDEIDVGDVSIVAGFIAHNDCLYFLDNNKVLYRVDFNDKKATSMFEAGGGSLLLNMCGDTLCIAVQFVDEGIYLSKQNGAFEKISDVDADELYLLDDSYVYYTAEEGKLYRLTVDGRKTERVY